MPKNIVIFGDGTGNDRTSDAYKTTVARLATRTRHDGTMPQAQIVHYEAGVGREFGDLIGKETGSGISPHIQSSYDFIVWCHDPGDTIFLFGFSRGAYTVRSLAGMLAVAAAAALITFIWPKGSEENPWKATTRRGPAPKRIDFGNRGGR